MSGHFPLCFSAAYSSIIRNVLRLGLPPKFLIVIRAPGSVSTYTRLVIFGFAGNSFGVMGAFPGVGRGSILEGPRVCRAGLPACPKTADVIVSNKIRNI